MTTPDERGRIFFFYAWAFPASGEARSLAMSLSSMSPKSFDMAGGLGKISSDPSGPERAEAFTHLALVRAAFNLDRALGPGRS